MNNTLRKISSLGLGLIALVLVVWGVKSSSTSAQVSVPAPTQVLVAICGNEIIEAPLEECDDGKHCQNLVSCTEDLDCNPGGLPIGDGLCKARNGTGCDDQCLEEPEGGGGWQPPSNIVITNITAYPELRSGTAGTNYDTDFYFSILNSDNLNREDPYWSSSLLSTGSDGTTSLSLAIPGIGQGIYDASFKSKAHLTKILDNAFLIFGNNFLNFTNPGNGASIGSVRLIAGDIDGFGNTPESLGDDVINSVDLSVLLPQFNTGNDRADLDQDGTVDQTDLNILLGNLDLEGDK